MTLYWTWALGEACLLLVTRTRRSDSSSQVHDRGSLPLLWLVIVASLTAGNWFSEIHPHELFGGASWVRVLAVAVMVVGLVVRWAAIFALGRSFSANVATHEGQTVLRTGLFALVRHPSYSGLLLIFLAVGLHTRNRVGLALCFLPPTGALLYRVAVEEEALRQVFGPEYKDYCRTTKRLIPWVF